MELPQTTQQAADTTDPRRGLLAIAALRSLTDNLEHQQVEAALRTGMSWQAIADCLGVSRQAVHKKYAKRIDSAIPLPRRKAP